MNDSGIGIKDEDKPKLFQLFGMLQDTNKKINTNGIGLGLVISQLIIQKFNGVIDFDSKFGEGSQFHFTFEVEPLDEWEGCNKKESNEIDFSLEQVDILHEEK